MATYEDYNPQEIYELYQAKQRQALAAMRWWQGKLASENRNVSIANRDYQKQIEALQRRYGGTEQELRKAAELWQLQQAQKERFGEATAMFRGAAEQAGAQNLRSILQAVQQQAQRRGISGSGVAMAAEAAERGRIGAQVAGAQASFAQQLLAVQQQNVEQFQLGIFRFFDSLQQLEKNYNFENNLIMLRDRLNQDAIARQQMYGLGQYAGQAITTLAAILI